MTDRRTGTAALRDQIRSYAASRMGGERMEYLSTGHIGCIAVMDLIISRSVIQALRSDVFVDRWVHDRLSHSNLNSKPTSLKRLRNWTIDKKTGNIAHDSGRFFTITGLQARHRTRDGELTWDQPIIDQPEFGILGILAAFIDGVLHFCLRLKEEPGNINAVQLSPTVQATYSNYMLSHGGSPPPFVSHFIDPRPDRIIISKLQCEDGGRFLFKSNRNMVVLVDDHRLPELTDEFLWLTLRQIAGLIRRDNIVNACSRSVLGCLL